MLKVMSAALLLAVAASLAAQDAPNKLKPPEVKLLRAGEGGMTFEATNPNAEPLPYLGYTANSFDPPIPKGSISPIFQVEVRQQETWKPHALGWCGTGIGPVSIEAKGKVTFAVFALPGEWSEVKVGLTWYDKADGKQSAVAWSQAIARKDIVEKKAP